MFKKIKKYLKVGIGAIVLTIAGAKFYDYSINDYARIVDVYSHEFTNVLFVGDTGEIGAGREKVIQEIKKINPEQVFILGDEAYPDGVHNENDFKKFVAPFLGDWKTHCVTGNHSLYGVKKENVLFMPKNSDRLGCKFVNFYRGEIYSNVCLLIIDSSSFDVKNNDEFLEKQEKFSHRFLENNLCKDKKKILAYHHVYFGQANHEGWGNKKLVKFLDELDFDIAFQGHEHVLAFYKTKNKEFYTSGAGSKLSECKKDFVFKGNWCESKLGFFVFRNNQIETILAR